MQGKTSPVNRSRKKTGTASAAGKRGPRQGKLKAQDQKRLAGRVRELEASLEKYKALVENAPDAIFFSDRNAMILSANKQAEALLGRTARQLVGKSLLDFAAPEDREDMERIMAEHRKRPTNERTMVERRFQRPDGRMITVEANRSMLVENGKFIGVQVIMRDITDWRNSKKAQEEQLRQLEEFKEFAVHREQEMIRLKRRIAELEARLGGEK